MLFFEALKGVQHQFFSRADALLESLLDYHLNADADDDAVTEASVFTPSYDILVTTLVMMSHYTKKEYTAVIWTSLVKALPSDLDGSSQQYLKLARGLSLVNVLVLARKGTRVFDSTSLLKSLEPLLTTLWASEHAPFEAVRQSVVFLISVTKYCYLQDLVAIKPVVRRLAASHFVPRPLLFTFFRETSHLPAFADCLLPLIVEYEQLFSFLFFSFFFFFFF